MICIQMDWMSHKTIVKLKPWQNQLMKYIEPHDREIIWVVGKYGGILKQMLHNTTNVVLMVHHKYHKYHTLWYFETNAS